MELLNAVLIVTKCENAEQLKNLSTKKIADYVSEELTNKLFEEVKNSIG